MASGRGVFRKKDFAICGARRSTPHESRHALGRSWGRGGDKPPPGRIARFDAGCTQNHAQGQAERRPALGSM